MLLIAGLAVAACGDDDGGGPTASENGNGDTTPLSSPVNTPAGTIGEPAICTDNEAQDGLFTTLEFSGDDGLYEQGEDVEITLTLINCGDGDVSLKFPTTQRYSIMIQDEDTAIEVWNAAAGKDFAEDEGEQLILQGETVVYTESWDQKNLRGDQVEPGMYKVSGFSVGCGGELQADCKFGPVRKIQVLE